MKLTMVSVDGVPRTARIEDDSVFLLPYPNIAVLMAQPDWRRRATGHEIEQADRSSVTLGQLPAVSGGKIICVGLNYRSHIEESGRPEPQYPTLFGKFPETLTGSTRSIVLPEVSDEVDWEVELGVVIGRRGRNISVRDAREYIGGFTIVNDVSMRDWQHRTNQWMAGKNFEATTPVGPVIVTPDEVDEAQDLRIVCEIDGVLMQEGRTSDQLFSPMEVISYISAFTTVLPGDLIAMGTPGGVAASRPDRPFIREGQKMRSWIEGIGACCNTFVRSPRKLIDNGLYATMKESEEIRFSGE